MDTTISNLELAIDGKHDFLRKTNPWRTQKDIDEENFNQSVGKENLANKLHAWAMYMQGKKPTRRTRQPGEKEGVVLPPGMEMPTVPIVKKD